MHLQDNKEIYSTQEFERWAFREGVDPGEEMLIRQYLDPSKSVLDAGTGGGRLVQYLRSLNFTDLHGFDYVPSMIATARQRCGAEGIDFQVQDAVRLTYDDAAFEQVMYLQQILCLIPSAKDRRQAMLEAYRVLAPGGTALFSFLSHRARAKSWRYRPFLWYLRLLRLVRGQDRSIQYLPWLRLNGSWNTSALLDAGPYVYWYREEEVCDELRAAGFQVAGVGSGAQITDGRLQEATSRNGDSAFFGALYVVCKK